MDEQGEQLLRTLSEVLTHEDNTLFSEHSAVWLNHFQDLTQDVKSCFWEKAKDRRVEMVHSRVLARMFWPVMRVVLICSLSTVAYWTGDEFVRTLITLNLCSSDLGSGGVFCVSSLMTFAFCALPFWVASYAYGLKKRLCIETFSRFDNIIDMSRLNRPSLTTTHTLSVPSYSDRGVAWTVNMEGGRSVEYFLPLAELKAVAETALSSHFTEEVRTHREEQTAMPGADDYQAYVWMNGQVMGSVNRIELPNGLVGYITVRHVASLGPLTIQRGNQAVCYLDTQPDYVWDRLDLAMWLETQYLRNCAAAMGWKKIPVKEVDGFEDKIYNIYYPRRDFENCLKFSTTPLDDWKDGFFTHVATTNEGDSGNAIISPPGRTKRYIVAVHAGGVIRKGQNVAIYLPYAFGLVGEELGYPSTVPGELITEFTQEYAKSRKNRRRGAALHDIAYGVKRPLNDFKRVKHTVYELEEDEEADPFASDTNVIATPREVFIVRSGMNGGTRHKFSSSAISKVKAGLLQESHSLPVAANSGHWIGHLPADVYKPPHSFVEYHAEQNNKTLEQYTEWISQYQSRWLTLRAKWRAVIRKKDFVWKSGEYKVDQVTLLYDSPWQPPHFIKSHEPEMSVETEESNIVKKVSFEDESGEDSPSSENRYGQSVSDQVGLLSHDLEGDFDKPLTETQLDELGSEFTLESGGGGKRVAELREELSRSRPRMEHEEVEIGAATRPIQFREKKTDIEGLTRMSRSFIEAYSPEEIDSLVLFARGHYEADEPDVNQIEKTVLPALNRKLGQFGTFIGAAKKATNEMMEFYTNLSDEQKETIGFRSWTVFAAHVKTKHKELTELYQQLALILELTPTQQEQRMTLAKSTLGEARQKTNDLVNIINSLRAGIRGAGGFSAVKGKVEELNVKVTNCRERLEAINVLIGKIQDEFSPETNEGYAKLLQQTGEIENFIHVLEDLIFARRQMASRNQSGAESSPGAKPEIATSSVASGPKPPGQNSKLIKRGKAKRK